MTIPDTVGLTIAWVNAIPALGATAGAEIPDPIPVDYIQVRRMGGPAMPPVRDQPLLQFSSWAASDLESMNRLQVIREGLWALQGTDGLGVTLYEVFESAGPTSTTDSQTSRRYAFMRTALTVRADDIIHQFS